jgi:hypothetical protein
MGYPLYIAAVGAGYWIVRRARHGMRSHITDELAAPEGEGERSAADGGAPDRGLGLG